MRGVDQPIDPVLGEVFGETGRTAKPADAEPAGERMGTLGSSGEGGGDIDPLAKAGEGRVRECCSLGCAAEDQEPFRRHPPSRSAIATSTMVFPENVASAGRTAVPQLSGILAPHGPILAKPPEMTTLRRLAPWSLA